MNDNDKKEKQEKCVLHYWIYVFYNYILCDFLYTNSLKFQVMYIHNHCWKANYTKNITMHGITNYGFLYFIKRTS